MPLPTGSTFNEAVPFLPKDATYTSNGVIKVPDARPKQLDFQGFFLPTAVSVDDKAPVSIFPAAANPLVGLFAYRGDLGLDDGLPQSVFVRDKKKLTQYKTAGGKPLRLSLTPGQTSDLPGGGTVEYVGTKQFVKLQFSSTPLLLVPLVGISVGVIGLMLSLAIRPRRTWLRARREGSSTVVEVATLDRVSRDGVPTDLEDLVGRQQAILDTGSQK